MIHRTMWNADQYHANCKYTPIDRILFIVFEKKKEEGKACCSKDGKKEEGKACCSKDAKKEEKAQPKP